jgi:hypothetical protein
MKKTFLTDESLFIWKGSTALYDFTKSETDDRVIRDQ